MKVLIISLTDDKGGAFIAARRLCQCLNECGVDAKMIVNYKFLSDSLFSISFKNKLYKLLMRIKPKIVDIFVNNPFSRNKILRSVSVFSNSTLVSSINSSDADVVNLHWVQREMISIKDIMLINKPVVWTMHDMWLFCGAEHYSDDLSWKHGYQNKFIKNYPFFDVNRWTWSRKRKYWSKPLHIVTPSNWLANCVRESILLKEWPVKCIGNPISGKTFYPSDKKEAKKKLKLDVDKLVISFGAVGGTSDKRKGFDLLLDALKKMPILQDDIDLQLLIFGQDSGQKNLNFQFPVHYTGHVQSENCLREIYSASDIFVIPSRLDNLPNTGVEAQFCGVPVVSFDIGGMRDIIKHEYNGYLAKPYDTEDFAKGILWVIGQYKNNSKINQNCIEYSRMYSFDEVGLNYKSIFKQAYNKFHNIS